MLLISIIVFHHDLWRPISSVFHPSLTIIKSFALSTTVGFQFRTQKIMLRAKGLIKVKGQKMNEALSTELANSSPQIMVMFEVG